MEHAHFEFLDPNQKRKVIIERQEDGIESLSEKYGDEEWDTETIPAKDPDIEEKHRKLIADGWIWTNEHMPEDRFRKYEKHKLKKAA